jgi:hypothetical protein
MSEIQSSGSVEFDSSNSSGVLADFAAEKTAAQEAQALEAAQMQWAEATAKDERVTNNRHAKSAETHRHGRSHWRARQDWNRTVRGVRRQTLTHSHAPDASPSMKGGGGFWAPLREWLDGLLGIR